MAQAPRKPIRGKDGKVQPPFLTCSKCSQEYITDISRIHGYNGIQFINFVATDQFIRKENIDPQCDKYLCVNIGLCELIEKEREEKEEKRLMAIEREKKHLEVMEQKRRYYRGRAY